jgi:hypothetical protein
LHFEPGSLRALTPLSAVALVGGTSFAAGADYILAMVYLDLNLSQLGHHLLWL